MKQPMQVLVSSQSNEWYTPEWIIKAARKTMAGQIDLDPATCQAANEWIGAEKIHTIHDDGLSQEWRGRVWLNPPRGKIGNKSSQGVWADKLIDEYHQGHVTEGIMLSKSAPGYEWWEDLFRCWPVCFVRDRVRFIKLDKHGEIADTGRAKAGTSIWYIAPPEWWVNFRMNFREYGRVIFPSQRRM